jgi:hypothetical protein
LEGREREEGQQKRCHLNTLLGCVFIIDFFLPKKGRKVWKRKVGHSRFFTIHFPGASTIKYFMTVINAANV